MSARKPKYVYSTSLALVYSSDYVCDKNASVKMPAITKHRRECRKLRRISIIHGPVTVKLLRRKIRHSFYFKHERFYYDGCNDRTRP